MHEARGQRILEEAVHIGRPPGPQGRADKGGKFTWSSRWKKNLHTQRAAFSPVNFPSELSDNKSTCKCKENREEKDEGEKEERDMNPLETINPTDSRAVNMNSICFCHLHSPAFLSADRLIR